MPQIGYSHRQVALGRDGMVASAHPLAAPAGLDTLKAGRNPPGAARRADAVPRGAPTRAGMHCARDGFPLSPLVSQAIDEYVAVTPDAEWHRVFAPRGRAAAPGALFVQADLGRTLADLAAAGPDLFYTGRVGPGLARRPAA